MVNADLLLAAKVIVNLDEQIKILTEIIRLYRIGGCVAPSEADKLYSSLNTIQNKSKLCT